jgi:hypothetical protein
MAAARKIIPFTFRITGTSYSPYFDATLSSTRVIWLVIAPIDIGYLNISQGVKFVAEISRTSM